MTVKARSWRPLEPLPQMLPWPSSCHLPSFSKPPRNQGVGVTTIFIQLYFCIKNLKKSLDLESTYSGKVPDDLIGSERWWGGPRPCLSPPVHSLAVWVRTRTRAPRKRTDGFAKSPGARCPAAGQDPDYRAVPKTLRDSGPSPSSCATSAAPIKSDFNY